MTTRRMLARLGATAAGTSVLALGLVAPASAHVTVTPSDTAAGAYTVLTFSVGHGCEGSPTTSIAIQIPEGINAATPTRNDYYDVEKTVEKLDPPVTDSHGNELTERVSTVTYTARTPLPDGYRDTFEVQVQLPEDAEGQALAFPTIQTCEKGETPWTEIAAEGQSEDDLESPAPAFEVTAAGADAHGAGEETAEPAEETAAETSSDTEASAEPASEASDDDSGNGLAIAGLVAGIAGILVGGFALLRGRTTSA
ncbi:YcnI family protein [Nocardioides sp. 1609]|uniref:YcnI family copper-binding membrane protein n=1 Tax=Nocardioides sp. 1609 TaxID=2508327 RepID=UPI00106F2703|nr:YcnI family protein [Nocardioides sp. 1609]